MDVTLRTRFLQAWRGWGTGQIWGPQLPEVCSQWGVPGHSPAPGRRPEPSEPSSGLSYFLFSGAFSTIPGAKGPTSHVMGVFWATYSTKWSRASRALATCSRLRVRTLLDRSWKEWMPEKVAWRSSTCWQACSAWSLMWAGRPWRLEPSEAQVVWSCWVMPRNMASVWDSTCWEGAGRGRDIKTLCFGGNRTPGASRVAQQQRIHLPVQEMWVRFLGREDPLEKEMATHSSTLAWENPMDRGAWKATVHRGAKSQTRLLTRLNNRTQRPGKRKWGYSTHLGETLSPGHRGSEYRCSEFQTVPDNHRSNRKTGTEIFSKKIRRPISTWRDVQPH